MRKLLPLAAALVPMALLSTHVDARSGSYSTDHVLSDDFLERFDTDGDGRVTRTEIEAVLAEDFASADTDADGLLSYAEFSALLAQYRQDKLQAEFDSLDTDASGSISEQEFSDGHPRSSTTVTATVFALADSDADALLSLDELAALKDNPDIWRFAELDDDGDGALSEDEFTSSSAVSGRRHR